MEPEATFSRLIFAQTNYSSEDIPSGISSVDACDYHAAWTSLWHPLIIDRLGFLPESKRTDPSGLDVENALILVPNASAEKLDQPLEERLALSHSTFMFSRSSARGELVKSLLRAIAIRAGGAEAEGSGIEQALQGDSVACSLAEDFHAFGYAVQQVQCMARKLRYSFNLDWMVVTEQLLSSARCFAGGDFEECDRLLAAAYDSLSQERDRYCSQQAYLMHLVLTASVNPKSAKSPIGALFVSELQRDTVSNVLATTETLEKIRSGNSQGFELLQHRLREKSLSLLGGFAKELQHTYLTEHALHRSFSFARREVQRLGLPAVTTLAPFRPGIPGCLPSIALFHGYQGALIARFSDGMIPEKEHAKLRWQETSESPALDTILGHVLDANDNESLLNFGTELAKQLDYHQVPTMVLAHWPLQVCLGFEDLLRAARRSPALGKFVLIDEYFASTSQPYWSEQFATPNFPFPVRGPSQRLHSIQCSLIKLHGLLYRAERIEEAIELIKPLTKLEVIQEFASKLKDLLHRCDAIAQHDSIEIESPENWYPALFAEIQQLQDQVGGVLQSTFGTGDGFAVVHPASHPARRLVRLSVPKSQLLHTKNERIVHACDLPDGKNCELLVDVPPYGFTSIPTMGSCNPDSEIPREKKSTGLFSKWFGSNHPVATPAGLLSNEFIEAQFDSIKGHLRAFYVRDQRGNRLSAMLSLVQRPLDFATKYSEKDFLALQSVSMESSNPTDASGVVSIRGGFITDVASGNGPRITQTFTMHTQAKWLEIHVKGSGFSASEHYPVWRMVWPSEAASLSLWAASNKSKWLQPLQANTELIEIDDAQYKLYIATGGLSVHRKYGPNQLVTALPISKDGSVDVRLFIGLQWQRPWETAIDLFQEPWVLQPKSSAAATSIPQSAWLAQCNHPNVRMHFLASDWVMPNLGEVPMDPGFFQPESLISILETAGKSGTAKISLPKKPTEAFKMNFTGQTLDKLEVQGSSISVPYGPRERCLVGVSYRADEPNALVAGNRSREPE
jgi:hypothetical protein